MKTKLNRKSRLLKISMVALASCAAIAVCEIFARIALPSPGSMDKRLVEPYLMTGHFYADSLLSPPADPEVYGYEQNGSLYVFKLRKKIRRLADRAPFLFNAREDLLARKNSETLVFAVGASVAQGSGASSPERYWYLHLEKLLSRKTGKNVRVIPVAIASYVSTQERIALELYALSYCPDAIIILDGWNDAASGLTGSRPGDPYNIGVLYASFYNTVTWGMKKSLADHSVLFRHFLTRSHQDSIKASQERLIADPALLAAHVESVANIYSENQHAMHASARARGIPVRTFLQPSQILAIKAENPSHRSDNPVEAVFVETYRKLIESAQRMKREGLQVENLTGRFTKASEFTDPVHLNDESQKKLAEILAEPVAEMLRLPASSGACVRGE